MSEDSTNSDKTARGNEVLDFTPATLPKAHLEAIGLMSVSASSTESIVEMAIAGMLGIDGEQGYAVTAHMSSPLRTSVLKSAAEIVLPDMRLLDELDRILDEIKRATDARNRLVHGSWAVRPSDGAVLLVRQESRTHVQVRSIEVTVDEIRLQATALYEAGMELMAFLIATDKVPALPREDRPRGVFTPQARKAARKSQMDEKSKSETGSED